MSAIFCQQRQFGTLETGETVTCYSLRNSSGMTVRLLDYAVILNTVHVPDSSGQMQEITLKREPKQNVPLGSTLVHLPLRYGIVFNDTTKMLWEADSMTEDNSSSIQLSRKGVMDLKYSYAKLDYQLTVSYTLTTANELIIRSQIQVSLPLPIFMTHYPAWNLDGKEEKDINHHILQVWADSYSDLDETGFSDLRKLDVHNEPAFNFEKPQRIGERYAQLSNKTNYDVCFRLAEKKETTTTYGPLVARVKAPISGRTLEVYTSQLGLRFYAQPSNEHTLHTFCLTPMPLLHTTDQSSFSECIQQETCYKLIW